MPDHFWNIIGALTIVAAVAASHPMHKTQADRLETQLASGWDQMIELSCNDAGSNQCLPIGGDP